jgi:hypothetical protein
VAITEANRRHLRELLESAMTADRERFDRAPLPYPAFFDPYIDTFVEAVVRTANGNLELGRELLATIDHAPMVEWFDAYAQNAGGERVKLLEKVPQRRGGGGKRDMRVSRVRAIAERDGWRCGYCDIRVVEPRVLRKVDQLLGGKVLRHLTEKRSNRSYHGIWLVTALTLDHIEPLAENHDDSDENLVTCCWACNFGKYHYTLDELGLLPPRQGRGPSDGWHGLTDIV